MNSSVACICFTGLCLSPWKQKHTQVLTCTCYLSYLYLSSIFLTISRKAESFKNCKRTDDKEEATGCKIFWECFLLGK